MGQIMDGPKKNGGKLGHGPKANKKMGRTIFECRGNLRNIRKVGMGAMEKPKQMATQKLLFIELLCQKSGTGNRGREGMVRMEKINYLVLN